MGYSGRYHAASLAAVFLALAVGILIGVGFGSDLVSGTADDLERSLHSDLDEKSAEIDSLQGELETERDFDQAVFPAVVADRLRNKQIGLIGLGGLDQGTANAVEATLDPAGGTLAEVAVVHEPPDLDGLAPTLDDREARQLARGDEETVRRFGERSGRALVRGSESFDELRGTLLSRYSGKPENIDAVVVVRQRPDDLDPDDEAAANALEEGLISGMADGATTVGAESSDSDPSSIGFFQDRGLATVDSIDIVSGKVALVYALGGKASGSFGVKESADSLLPDLLPPGRGTGGGQAQQGSGQG
jgi:hypothetical protein